MKDVKCPYCDVALSAESVTDGWCAECGKKLPRSTTRPSEPPRKRTNRRALIFWGVLVLVFGPVGFFFKDARRGKLGAFGDVVLVVAGVFFVVFLVALVVTLFTGSRDSSPPDG